MTELSATAVTIESRDDTDSVRRDEWHDLLPVEKKLIFSSLGLGVALLIVFIFAFGVFK